MILNKADNYIQPVQADLQPDNIIMLGNTFLLVASAKPEYIEASNLLSKEIEITDYPYTNIIGVDLKEWIITLDIKHVIDSLLLFNGYSKLNDGMFAYKYVRGNVTIRMGGFSNDVSIWYIDTGHAKYPVSYLHEIQNFHNDTLRKPLTIKGAF